MAKGRTLTISRSERFLGTYRNTTHDHDHDHDHGVELREDDVWSMVDHDMVMISSSASLGGSRRRQPPASASSAAGLSVAFDDHMKTTVIPPIVHQSRNGSASLASSSPRGRHVASSLPVNVPDWSKIYRVDSEDSDEDSESGSGMVPPHEYLARSHRSVFEGVGRTLKGRDLSRVRDAVWSQTGFDG